MSRTQVKSNFPQTFNSLARRVASLERTLNTTGLRDINTTGLTSAQIDAAFFGGQQSYDGAQATDKANSLALVRQAGKWHSAALTLIP